MNNIYFFLLLKIFNRVARCYKINWKTEKVKTCGSICFRHKINIIKIKLLVANSPVTEVNELKNIYIAIFRLTFRLIFRLNFSNANF